MVHDRDDHFGVALVHLVLAPRRRGAVVGVDEVVETVRVGERRRRQRVRGAPTEQAAELVADRDAHRPVGGELEQFAGEARVQVRLLAEVLEQEVLEAQRVQLIARGVGEAEQVGRNAAWNRVGRRAALVDAGHGILEGGPDRLGGLDRVHRAVGDDGADAASVLEGHVPDEALERPELVRQRAVDAAHHAVGVEIGGSAAARSGNQALADGGEVVLERIELVRRIDLDTEARGVERLRCEQVARLPVDERPLEVGAGVVGQVVLAVGEERVALRRRDEEVDRLVVVEVVAGKGGRKPSTALGAVGSYM